MKHETSSGPCRSGQRPGGASFLKCFATVACLFALAAFSGCSRRASSAGLRDGVVLYSSQDQFNAEPILAGFTAKTGTPVRSVFDTESAKTAGLANRLRAEKTHPQCDVFWSNEELHARLLVQEGVLLSNEFRAAGYRTRCLILNTNTLPLARAPRSLLELTNSVWNGKVALAYPLFGTTASHFLALRQAWGEALWKQWCYGLVRNGAKVVDGNSVVVKLVGRGEAFLGLTDSDDLAAGLDQKLPLAEVPLGREGFVIRTTMGLVKEAPHPEQARALLEFLSNPATLDRLVKARVLRGSDPGELEKNTLHIDWATASADLEAANAFLEFIFVRS